MDMLSKRMLALRQSVSLSQMKLAKALGIAQSAINRYEHNMASVPASVVLKYADYFDVSADYLLGRTDKPEGIAYQYEPETLKRKAVREEEWSDFIEACFDPRSPMNKKLKKMMLSMKGGGQT